jgi:hypothetical protein
VYFEEGAEGGMFVGVFFIMPTDLEEVRLQQNTHNA